MKFGIERKWWTLAVIGSGTFMSALDTSIVNIALPIIGKTTKSPVSTIEWVVLIYLITVSSSLLIFGRLADIYGKRNIYMSGQIIFALGSLCCGLSGHIGLLIASRALQAMGAAMLFALSPAIIVSTFPSKERGAALGMQATMTYLGMSIGPALGGLLTQYFGWPSIFFVNVPIGLAMVCVSAGVLNRDDSGDGQAFDPIGAGTMAVALATLLFALSKGPETGWSSPFILSMLAVAAISGLTFVMIESKIKHPALDFRLFANKRFTASTMSAFLCYAATASVSFLMPFFLMHACGYRADHAGIILMATPIAMMILTGPSGFLSDRVGVRLPTTLGMAVMAVGILLLRSLNPASSPHQITMIAAMIGVGAGLFTAPNNSAIMGSAPSDKQGVAGAILAAARTTGFASGVALTGVVYVSRLHALRTLPEPIAITHAVQASAIVIASIASVGAVLSAFRGNPKVSSTR
ncbi:MAG: MFS transporter [Armatimonadota bacterium]|nr:MFS transporter [bacterium]